MIMRLQKILFGVTLLSLNAALWAADAPKDPSRQTSWGLYVDSREAYQMKTGAHGKDILLVDVRDPIEIMFTGFTDVADLNIPTWSTIATSGMTRKMSTRWK